jgi:hypothetical protein
MVAPLEPAAWRALRGWKTVIGLPVVFLVAGMSVLGHKVSTVYPSGAALTFRRNGGSLSTSFRGSTPWRLSSVVRCKSAYIRMITLTFSDGEHDCVIGKPSSPASCCWHSLEASSQISSLPPGSHISATTITPAALPWKCSTSFDLQKTPLGCSFLRHHA